MKWKIDNYNGHPLIVNINDIFEGIQQISDEGLQGPAGEDGTDGANGWSPIFAIEDDFERRVLKLVDWTGGTGTKPTASIGKYIGSTGLVINATNAVDIRGSAGEDGTDGINGMDGTDGLSLEFNWDGTSLGVRQEGTTTYQYVDLGAGATSFTDLTDTPSTLGSNGQYLGLTTDLANGGVMIEWKNFPSIPSTLDDLSDFPAYSSTTTGQYLTAASDIYGDVNLEWTDIPESSNVGTLLDLTDTPSAYGTSTQILSMNATGDAVEWVDMPTGGSGASAFSDLTDTPTAYTGSAGKLVAVNTTEDALEYVDAPSGGGGASVTTGTWTPTIVIDNSGTAPTGISYLIQSGTWTRIGDYVTVTGRLRWSDGSASEQLRVPLPFSPFDESAVTVSAAPNGDMPRLNFIGDVVGYCTAAINSYNEQIWFVSDTGTLMAVDSGHIQFSVSYFIDTSA